MAIDLDITLPEKMVKKTFELPESLASSFALYVQAAQDGARDVSEDAVLRALIERQLRKDRKFKEWMAARNGSGRREAPATDG